MAAQPTHVLGAILIGLGATLAIDLWGQVLKRGFGIVSLNYCLLGRWLLHMPEGTLVHPNIAAARPKTHECPVGWSAHYLIGVSLGLVFVLIVSGDWLERPTLLPALAFGVVTVAMPWLVMVSMSRHRRRISGAFFMSSAGTGSARGQHSGRASRSAVP